MTTIKAKRDCHVSPQCYHAGDEFTVYWREGLAEIRCNHPSGERHFLVCVDDGAKKSRNVKTASDLHLMEDFEVLPEADETPELVPAPEGVEFAMRIFIHCDAAGISHVLNFPGNRFVPPADDAVDVADLIDQLHAEERAMLKAAGFWRVMTRAEISRYKARMARLAAHREAEAKYGRG